MARFRLHRFAIVTPEKSSAIDQFANLRIDEVDLTLSPVHGAEQRRYLLMATVQFNASKLTGLNDINVCAARSRCEEALVVAHELITTASGHGLTLRSSRPIFIVDWPDENDPDVGNDSDWTRSSPIFRQTINISQFNITRNSRLLEDRRTGIALMSQALSNMHAVGKVVALCRVIEDAFAEQLTMSSAKRLSAFLLGANLEYDDDEVSSWISMRGNSAHGDLKYHVTHATEIDVISLLPRLQQAVYDVLFNKARWHYSDLIRRQAWYPSTAFLRDAGHMQVTVGEHTSIGQEEFDPYTGWPMSDDGHVKPPSRCRRPILSGEIPMKITAIVPPFQLEP